MTTTKHVYVLHENEAWVAPLADALKQQDIPYREWFLSEGAVNLEEVPPQGVFYNRMSASSHTRNHPYAVELTESTIAWLELYERRVVNNRRAIQLETRKAEQYLAMQRLGLKTPNTVVAVGEQALLDAAHKFEGKPFILKPNRGGKGLGVQLFYSPEALEAQLTSGAIRLEDAIGGTWLVQDYIEPKDRSIVRLEFIGGQFYYAVRVDTAEGFELCPADSCQVGDAFCPTTDDVARPKFEVLKDFYIPEIPRLQALLRNNGIEIGAVEFATNSKGERFFYDLNINTNYNAAAEERSQLGKHGMSRIAAFLGQELAKVSDHISEVHVTNELAVA